MTLSRLELKSTRFQFASYYVKDLLADCCDSMQPIAEKKNIQIVLEPVTTRPKYFAIRKPYTRSSAIFWTTRSSTRRKRQHNSRLQACEKWFNRDDGVLRQRFRDWYSGRRSSAAIRAVLSRGQGPFPADRRDRISAWRSSSTWFERWAATSELKAKPDADQLFSSRYLCTTLD